VVVVVLHLTQAHHLLVLQQVEQAALVIYSQAAQVQEAEPIQ
jgi:hypothetical protein